MVIDMAHWRALKSPSTVVKSMDDDPEAVQLDDISSVALLLNDSVRSLTIVDTVEFDNISVTILGVLLNVSFSISEI